MAINLDKPHLWKQDIRLSVDMYNEWFLRFAPEAFRSQRLRSTEHVKAALEYTGNLVRLDATALRRRPEILQILRMACCPPIARDRLIGLGDISPNLVKSMEVDQMIPSRMRTTEVMDQMEKILSVIKRLLDPDIATWIESGLEPNNEEAERAATIIADRLCGARSDPIIRNAQESRQLSAIKSWLEDRGYVQAPSAKVVKYASMVPGTFAFRVNVPVKLEGGAKEINIPIDAAIMRRSANPNELPLLIEAKSAGDYTNVNKRRKEEAMKMSLLQRNFKSRVRFILFLCGYFDSGYLGYEAAEGIDWIWEHRIDDLAALELL